MYLRNDQCSFCDEKATTGLVAIISTLGIHPRVQVNSKTLKIGKRCLAEIARTLSPPWAPRRKNTLREAINVFRKKVSDDGKSKRAADPILDGSGAR